MVWLRSMRGLKVVMDGKCLGRVIQGCLCDTLTALDGFWMDRAVAGIRFISADHICVLGASTIIVDHPGERLRMKPHPLMIRAVSTDGARIGAVIDAGVNEQTLAVDELAITTGWLESLFCGLTMVRSYKFDLAGARVIINPDASETEVKP